MRLAGVRLVPSASMEMPNSTPPHRLRNLLMFVCVQAATRARGGCR